jgi:hypothetical protein
VIVKSIMWEWIIIGVVYVLSLFLFRMLGGLGAAARAFEMWGRSRVITRISRVSSSS